MPIREAPMKNKTEGYMIPKMKRIGIIETEARA
jgi:hypothetical protein